MRPPRTSGALCHVLRGAALLLALAPSACGKVQSASDAALPEIDATPCVPVGADLPDDTFADADCDGVDGEASDAVFLDPVNGSDTGDGTRSRPKAHLLGATGALMAAVATGKHHVFVSTGTLSETAPVVVPDGISVWGGYDASQAWTRSDAIARPLVQVADPTAVRFENTTTGMTWDRVDVRSADATAAGASSYGIVMVSATDVLLISNATVTAGSGAAGASSATPPTPVTALTANGGVGSGLVSSTCCVALISDTCVAGTSGQNTCAFGGGVGARCGQGAGSAPTAGSGPGGGLPGGLREQGRPGAPGAPGSNAVAPAEAFGVTAANGYTPPQGTIGTSGSAGAGGGGGGLDYVGSCQCNTNVAIPPGHGGGAGGCGGGAATVAGGGGGSFGLFLVDSSPKLERVALESGAGGAGGAGAAGGSGGAGGFGGGQPNATVAGGNGGLGGTGGTSSGGPGGPSICLEKVGTSSPALVTTPSCTLGAAGAGGISPDSSLDGQPGLAAAEHPQP